MIPFIRGLADAANDLNAERGGIVLFILLEREEAPGQWHLVVSADWIVPNELAALQYIVEKVRSRTTLDDYLTLSVVVGLKPTEPFVQAVTSSFRAVAGNPPNEFRNCVFGDIAINHAYIFISDPEAKPDPTKPLPWPTAEEATRRLGRGLVMRDTKTGRFLTNGRSSSGKASTSRRGSRSAK